MDRDGHNLDSQNDWHASNTSGMPRAASGRDEASQPTAASATWLCVTTALAQARLRQLPKCPARLAPRDLEFRNRCQCVGTAGCGERRAIGIRASTCVTGDASQHRWQTYQQARRASGLETDAEGEHQRGDDDFSSELHRACC